MACPLLFPQTGMGKSTQVSRIAHISDVHLLAAGPSVGRAIQKLSIQVVSLGRSLDPLGRARKLRRSLRAAIARSADHIIISGDLTETGTADQFEVLAETLHDARIAPEHLTLVPGNHDAYDSANSWRRALEGPLRDYKCSGASAPGDAVERGHVLFLPVDVSFHQTVARSAGEFTEEWAAGLERRLSDPRWRHHAKVIVQHHPPFAHDRRAWQWIDGLQGHERLLSILRKYPEVHLLHGHSHRTSDIDYCRPGARVFGAPAVVDDSDDEPRVRFYDVAEGALVPGARQSGVVRRVSRSALVNASSSASEMFSAGDSVSTFPVAPPVTTM